MNVAIADLTVASTVARLDGCNRGAPGGARSHNATVTARVRVPREGPPTREHVAESHTTVQGLLALRDWLEAHDVDRAAMEATGVY